MPSCIIESHDQKLSITTYEHAHLCHSFLLVTRPSIFSLHVKIKSTGNDICRERMDQSDMHHEGSLSFYCSSPSLATQGQGDSLEFTKHNHQPHGTAKTKKNQNLPVKLIQFTKFAVGAKRGLKTAGTCLRFVDFFF